MMALPQPVRDCLDTLEAAGFDAWCVGGCVRDALLGLKPQDYDMCTSATPEEISRVFAHLPQVHNGEKHGTAGVIVDHCLYEITTFRTEGGYVDHRHPDWVRFVSDIKEDLQRRDFTVNAMAYSPARGLCDPFGGQNDLQNKVLRAVGDPEKRFSEDALRILRGARFAARYSLNVEEKTEKAMFGLAPLMENLARERVFSELCKLLLLASTQDLLRFAPLITQVIPELAPAVGFDQRNTHHAFDVYTHTCHVVAGVAAELPLKWAALLHDVGKPATFTLDEAGQGHFLGHAKVSAALADAVLRRLKAPTALREQAVFLIEKHMTPLEPDKKLLRRRLSRYGEENIRLLLALQKADFGSKDVRGETQDFDNIAALLEEILAENSCLSIRDLAVNGHDLMALGLEGPKIGETLQNLLEAVLEDRLPNEKQALLEAVER
ncbi:MAG: HD domain-containing protein [Oscillospiraceae bacterium]|nr:HD domain-containing protein [Oscillospiraceae bacterium]